MSQQYRIDIVINGGGTSTGTGGGTGRAGGAGLPAAAAIGGSLGGAYGFASGLNQFLSNDAVGGEAIRISKQRESLLSRAIGPSPYSDDELNQLHSSMHATGLTLEILEESSKAVQDKLKQEIKIKKQRNNMNSAAKYSVLRTASYLSSRVDVWTGDSVAQQKLNNTMKLGIAGYFMATGNPLIAIAGLGLEAGFHAIDYHQKRRWDSFNEVELQRRAGLARYASNRGVTRGRT
jgi:hypothetical protein